MPGSSGRLSVDLLRCASRRFFVPTECTEADLRRATSDIYYALFHVVCETLVESIGNEPENQAFVEIYRALYRLPDHQYLEKKCKEALSARFSIAVTTLAQHLISMKNKRALADYDPLEQFELSAVANDLRLAESAITGFRCLDPTERSRFAIFVALETKRTK